MPPVVALIPVIASVAVTFLKVSAVVKALILIAATAVTMLLRKKPKGNRLSQGVELQKRITPNHPRQVLVGLMATAGSVHFAFTAGSISTKGAGVIPNAYLYRVIQLSDQPCDGLVRITEGKTILSFNGDVTTGWRECTIHRDSSGDPKMWVRVYLGSMTPTADATLISESGGRWTVNHKGTGLCYAIVKYGYDYKGEAFPNGEPELVFVLRGAKCYDDRKDSTVPGGSGTHRINDYNTWEYSENTAVVTAQYLRGFRINGKMIVGVGAEPQDLLSSMLFSAFNTCDQVVGSTGGNIAKYTTGFILNSNESAQEHLADFQLAMDGSIYDRGGSITLWPGAVRSPVMAISPQDIDWTAEKSWQPKASLESAINYVAGNIIDKDNYFQEKDLPPRVNATWEAEDGGERLQAFFSFRAINNWSLGQRITKRIHDASRYDGMVAFVGGIWLIEMEQGDWFTLTAPRWNMSGKYFECEDIVITNDMRVAVVGREVSTTLDSWAHATDEFARGDSLWNPPSVVIPPNAESAYIDGPNVIQVPYDHTGTIFQAPPELQTAYRVVDDAGNIFKEAVWFREVIEGSINGVAAPTALLGTASINGVGFPHVSSMETAEAKWRLTANVFGFLKVKTVDLVKVLAPPPAPTPPSPPPGGGGSDVGASQTSGFTSLVSPYNAWVPISNQLNYTTGVGQTTSTTTVNLQGKFNKTADQVGPWNVEYRIVRYNPGTSLWDIIVGGITRNSNPDAYLNELDFSDGGGGTFIVSEPAVMQGTFSDSGLTASTAYKYRVESRITSGTLPTNTVAMSFTGSVDVGV